MTNLDDVPMFNINQYNKHSNTILAQQKTIPLIHNSSPPGHHSNQIIPKTSLLTSNEQNQN